MPETDVINCQRCAVEGTTMTHHPIGGTSIGPIVDFGMAVRFFCEECFDFVRHSPHEKARMNNWLDACEAWAQASVSKVTDTDLADMENLPEGLKVTPSDRARHARLKDKLDKVEELQDLEDLACLVRICRNINKNPFQHPKTGMVKDYDSLKEDFKKLEKLSPEERQRLDG